MSALIRRSRGGVVTVSGENRDRLARPPQHTRRSPRHVALDLRDQLSHLAPQRHPCPGVGRLPSARVAHGHPSGRRVRRPFGRVAGKSRRRPPRDYGLALGDWLFHGAVGKLFGTALTETSRGDRLHVLLSVGDGPLRGYNWERLCGPAESTAGRDAWDFLALNQRTPTALYVAGATDRRFPPVGFAAFRTLLVVACPSELSQAQRFDVTATATALRPALGANAQVLGDGLPATLPNIIRRLSDERFTVLHVVCHGEYPKGAGGDFRLLLDGGGGKVARLPGSHFLREVKGLPAGHLPYLTFLSACGSAEARPTDHDRFAQTFARELSLPAVVGMAVECGRRRSNGADGKTPSDAGRRAGHVHPRRRGVDAGAARRRALVVPTPAGAVAYLVCRPATQYYRIMTGVECMPVLIGEVI